MIRCDSFARSIGFAALAGIGWLPWLWSTGPLLGARTALALYLIGVLILYVAGLAGRHAAAGRVAAVAGLAAGAVALAAATPLGLVLGLALVLGIARSGFLYRAAPARAGLTEVALLASGLLFAGFLAGPGVASVGLALWGFLLVQSLFFLAADARTRQAAPRADRFDEAHRRALALLDGHGV